jgi:hypothetical protein
MVYLVTDNMVSCRVGQQLYNYYVLERWTEILDNGGALDAIYFDFMKAFDTVPHKRLIGKLESYGISEDLIEWVKSFLTDRR